MDRCGRIRPLDRLRLILYGYPLSSASYRVRIALALKGLEVTAVTKQLRSGEHLQADFLKINPQGFVPALGLNDGEVLTQSLAIIEYLEEKYPDPPLLPSTPVARARVRALCQLIACDVHPLNNLRVLKYLKGQLSLDKSAREAWYHHWIEVGFAALEQCLGKERRAANRGAANRREANRGAANRPPAIRAASAMGIRPAWRTCAWCRRCSMPGDTGSTSRLIRASSRSTRRAGRYRLLSKLRRSDKREQASSVARSPVWPRPKGAARRGGYRPKRHRCGPSPWRARLCSRAREAPRGDSAGRGRRCCGHIRACTRRRARGS